MSSRYSLCMMADNRALPSPPLTNAGAVLYHSIPASCQQVLCCTDTCSGSDNRPAINIQHSGRYLTYCSHLQGMNCCMENGGMAPGPFLRFSMLVWTFQTNRTVERDARIRYSYYCTTIAQHFVSCFLFAKTHLEYRDSCDPRNSTKHPQLAHAHHGSSPYDPISIQPWFKTSATSWGAVACRCRCAPWEYVGQATWRLLEYSPNSSPFWKCQYSLGRLTIYRRIHPLNIRISIRRKCNSTGCPQRFQIAPLHLGIPIANTKVAASYESKPETDTPTLKAGRGGGKLLPQLHGPQTADPLSWIVSRCLALTLVNHCLAHFRCFIDRKQCKNM